MILGIDVGVSGAVGVVDREGRYLSVFDLPTMDVSVGKKARNAINPSALYRQLSLMDFKGDAVAYVERIHAMPKNGVITAFSQGHALGTVVAILAALEISYHLITPQTWKKHFALPGGKEMKEKARARAIQLYPMAPLFRKKDADRAESLLIARWAYESAARQGGSP